MRYSITAKPTFFKGVRYRSRLEARWACFFDGFMWPFKYEPFDLGQWSPDFLLGDSILVEVKPISKFDPLVGRKMVDAASSAKWGGELLLLGLGPQSDRDYTGPWWGPPLGWLYEPGYNAPFEDGDWGIATFGMSGRRLDFSGEFGYGGRITGCGYKEGRELSNAQIEQITAGWVKAGNIVQWRRT